MRTQYSGDDYASDKEKSDAYRRYQDHLIDEAAIEATERKLMADMIAYADKVIAGASYDEAQTDEFLFMLATRWKESLKNRRTMISIVLPRPVYSHEVLQAMQAGEPPVGNGGNRRKKFQTRLED